MPLLDLSYALTELPDRATFLQAAHSELSALLPADELVWMSCDFAAGHAVVQRGTAVDRDLGRRLTQAADHPAILSYLADPADLSPRRLSDVADHRAWSRTAAADLLDDPLGRHQLSMVVRLAPPAQGDGWIFGRSGLDFGAHDLELAASLLPLLTTLDRLYTVKDAAAHTVQQPAVHLTRRELDILLLLADGLTAQAIGRVHRISTPTVRKHLQNIYAKLGVSDRMLAVDRARQLAVLPAAAAPVRPPDPPARPYQR